MSDYEWQEKALKNFVNNDGLGIIVAPTGAGKTRLGISAVRYLSSISTTLVLVHTTVLLNQWKKELGEVFGSDNVGVYYGSEKNLKFITVGIINSVYNDFQKFDNVFDFIIYDEVHHIPSNEYKKLLNLGSKYKLGLTATINRSDELESLIFEKIGKIVYKYNEEEAQRDGVINKFNLFNVSIKLTDSERIGYDRYSEYIKNNYAFSKEFKDQHFIIKRVINARKEIIFKCDNKLLWTTNFVQENVISKKIIVFNEYNELATKLYNSLDIKNKFLIHSSINKKQGIKFLMEFSDCDSGVLFCSKMFDEGLNIVDIDCAIIVSGNSTERQFKQRVGRCLRIKDKIVSIYQLYCCNTIDEKNCGAKTKFVEDYCSRVYWEEYNV